MEKLAHYQNTSVPQDASLLGDDIVTFSVLAAILQTPCTDIYTNHKSVILCYSTAPYPVWVWCKDLQNSEDVALIAQCLKENFPFEKGFYWNIEERLLQKLQGVDLYFADVQKGMQLLSYRLDTLNTIDRPIDGHIAIATQEDIPVLCKLWHDMHFEMEGFTFTDEQCLTEVQNYVGKNAFYVVKEDFGNILATAIRWDDEHYCKVSAVYTLPEHRRKGYAINLVHHVAKDIMKDGKTPILYTDASYGASNECYQKIGFQQVGSLVAVKREEE